MQDSNWDMARNLTLHLSRVMVPKLASQQDSSFKNWSPSPEPLSQGIDGVVESVCLSLIVETPVYGVSVRVDHELRPCCTHYIYIYTDALCIHACAFTYTKM